MTNNHSMITRSKALKEDYNTIDDNNEIIDDIDENGNIKGFIDYDMEDDPKAFELLREHLYGISNGSTLYKPNKKKKKYKKQKKLNKNKINEIFLNYLLLKANESLKINKKKKKRLKSKVKVIEEIDDNYSTDSISSDESFILI